MAVRPVPPPDELTPSEIVLLKGDTFAPPPPKERGLSARVEAEARFGAGYLIAIVIGLAFLLGLAQVFQELQEESWRTIDSDSLVLGWLGLMLLLGGVGGWIWMRRRAAPHSLAPPGTTPLLDDTRAASTRELATSMLMAALLANEKAGAIAFENSEDGPVAIPTGVDPGWPAASMEHRLLRDVPVPVSALVSDWLASDSYDPWGRAVNVAKVCAVVRGFAEEQRNVADLAFRLRSDARTQYASLQPAAAEALLEDCRSNWPDWWQALRGAIARGLDDRIHRRNMDPGDEGYSQDSFKEPSPWELEAAADRRTGEAQPTAAATWVLYAVLAFIAPVLVLLVARPMGALVPVLVAWGLGTVGMLYLSRSREGAPPGVPTMADEPLSRRVPMALLGALLTAGLLTLLAWYSVLARFALGLGAVMLVRFAIRRKTEQKIQKRLLELDAAQIATDPPSKTPTPAPPSPGGIVDTGPPIPLEVHYSSDLPHSETLMAETDVHAQRAKALRRVRWEALITLVGGYALIAGTFWYPGPTFVESTDTFERQVPVLLMILTGLTLFLGTLFYFWTRRTNEGFGLVVRQMEESELHPWSLIILTGFWLSFIVINVPLLFQPWCGPRETLFAAVALSFVAGHILWTRHALARLEARYPVHPPLRLAMLRVFGSPALEDLITSINPWRGFGVIEHLHGPGTSGSELSDFMNVVRGRIDDSLAENDAELDREFANLRQAPDRNLRFSRDAIQCTLASWRKAVGRMLARADAVVMDLSNMLRKNEGCAYELGRLVDEVPLGRVTLLVNDATDMTSLEETLNDASRRVAPTSPNRCAEGLSWRIVHTGGLSARGEGESVHDWKRRTNHRLGSLALTALLRASALPRRSRVGTGNPDAVPQVEIRWAREPLGPRVHRALNVVLFLMIGLSAAVAVIRLAANRGWPADLPGCETSRLASARPG